MDDLIPGVVTWILLVLMAVQFVHLTSERSDTGLQVRLLLSAATLRFAFSILIYHGGLLNVLGDEDASGWLNAFAVQTHWAQNHISPLNLPEIFMEACSGVYQARDYTYALLFTALGLSGRLVAAALNCVAGSMTVIFIYRSAKILFGSAVGVRAAWWTCYFPSLITWSAVTIKEPIVLCLECGALYGFIRSRESGFSLASAMLCVGSIVLLLPFRFYAPYIITVAVIVPLLSGAIARGRQKGWVPLIVSMTLVLSLAQISGRAPGGQSFNLNTIQDFRRAVSVGGAAAGNGSGVITGDIRTPQGFAQGISIGAAHLLLAPFPWEFSGGSTRMALTLPELLFWWWLFFVAVIPGMRFAIREKLQEVAPLAICIIGFGILYSLMFGNIGLVFRQRAQLLPWLLILAAVGMEQRAQRRAQRETTSRQSEHPGSPTSNSVVQCHQTDK